MLSWNHFKESYLINTQFVNRQSCSEGEKQSHIQYLMKTPVSGIVTKIEEGALLSKGEIQSRDVLGSLTTIFSDLGNILASQRHDESKFLVRQVLPALRDSSCNDKDTLRKVECYRKLYEAKSLIVKITICEDGDSCMIIDGNKRASAIYNSCLSSFTPVMVYLISC
jgi:hypothetical protein